MLLHRLRVFTTHFNVRTQCASNRGKPHVHWPRYVRFGVYIAGPSKYIYAQLNTLLVWLRGFAPGVLRLPPHVRHVAGGRGKSTPNHQPLTSGRSKIINDFRGIKPER